MLQVPQAPQARDNAHLAPHRADGSTILTQKQYNDHEAEHISASIPSGVLTNELSVRDPAALVEATKSANFTGFVFIGGNAVELDDSRSKQEYHSSHKATGLLSNQAVILPKTIHRRSVKDLKRQVRFGKTVSVVRT